MRTGLDFLAHRNNPWVFSEQLHIGVIRHRALSNRHTHALTHAGCSPLHGLGTSPYHITSGLAVLPKQVLLETWLCQDTWPPASSCASPTPRAYSKSYYTRAGRRQLCSCLIPDSNSVFRTKVAGPGYLQDAPPVPPMDSDILFRHRLSLLAAPVSNTLCSHVKIWGETALITGSFAKLCFC